MAKAVAIALFSVLHSGAFAFPSPQNDPQATSAKFQWQIYKSCDEGNKNTIFEAWEDSKKFADALAAWKPKADYQQAMDMYMGSRSTFEDFSGFDFPKQIQGQYSISPQSIRLQSS
jgi:hypothetical protein